MILWTVKGVQGICRILSFLSSTETRLPQLIASKSGRPKMAPDIIPENKAAPDPTLTSSTAKARFTKMRKGRREEAVSSWSHGRRHEHCSLTSILGTSCFPRLEQSTLSQPWGQRLRGHTSRHTNSDWAKIFCYQISPLACHEYIFSTWSQKQHLVNPYSSHLHGKAEFSIKDWLHFETHQCFCIILYDIPGSNVK